ncbi:hypothetical protein CsSME_00052399 [Camellia sinensis var. sinensis]
MPKDESAPHRRASPYAHSPINSEQYKPKSCLQSVGRDNKEWEQVRCPTMPHLHGASSQCCPPTLFFP